MKLSFCICLILLPALSAMAETERQVVPAKTEGRKVSKEVMQRIYDEVKTPHKYGVVLKHPDGKMVDSPSVFRHGDKWYMVYITFDGDGYETEIAESANLLEWKPLGKILPFRENTWDGVQAAGYIALQDYQWGGSSELQTHDDKYWLSYLGGNLKGYETDPLKIGIAYTDDPSKGQAWTRLPEPVLTKDQPDCRDWEKTTQFKSHIIHDKAESLGYAFVMYYNARTRKGYEAIGMAVSKDMKTWLRYGVDPVVENPVKGTGKKGRSLTGDPQITKIGDVWVMHYFGAFYRPKAFDTFACSYDLVTWTKWEGKDLIEPSEPWDQKYAHKPWVIKHDDVVYHFYCAVGDQGRVIALASSKDLKAEK